MGLSVPHKIVKKETGLNFFTKPSPEIALFINIYFLQKVPKTA